MKIVFKFFKTKLKMEEKHDKFNFFYLLDDL